MHPHNVAGERALHLVWELDVAAACGLVAPAPGDVADGVAAASENKHGLAKPEESGLQPKTTNKKYRMRFGFDEKGMEGK